MIFEHERDENIIGEEASTTPEPETAGADNLQKALAEATARAEANLAGWQRAAADMANYRKRTDLERSELLKSANADLIRRLLPVIDDMERGFETIPAELANLPWVEGMRLIGRKMLAILEQEGVTQYSALGEAFDPTFHDAITMEPTDPANDGKVIGEIQKGYKVRDRVLRPALVRVGQGRTSK